MENGMTFMIKRLSSNLVLRVQIDANLVKQETRIQRCGISIQLSTIFKTRHKLFCTRVRFDTKIRR